MQPASTELAARLAAGDLEGVLNCLLALARQHQDAARSTEATLLSGRFQNLKNRHDQGLLDNREYQIGWAQILATTQQVVQKLPADWVVAVQPSAPSVPAVSGSTPPSAVKKQGFLERWGAILSILASVAGVTGLTLSNLICPNKNTTETTTPASKQPETQPVANPTSRTETAQPTTGKPVSTPQQKATTNPSTPPVSNPVGASGADTFKPLGDPAGGMQRGKVGKKFAFRKGTNGSLLCCFDDAEDFDNGRAYVKQGERYFYIDKTGKEVE